MSPRSFKELFDEARRRPEFYKELAILEFTEELYRTMEEQGVSHTELGRRIGSSQAYISRVLNGGANFTLASMTKLSAALGMELRLHLAPAESATVWRDVVSGQTGTREIGTSVLTARLEPMAAASETSRAAHLYVTPVTQAGIATATSAERGARGAAAPAA